jgi:hypothetical protein
MPNANEDTEKLNYHHVVGMGNGIATLKISLAIY